MSDSGTKDATASKNRVEEPRRFKVIILNDDFTPYEFVVDILKSVFRKDQQAANAITLQIHASGFGLAGVYTRDIAETKAGVAVDRAQAAGHPLIVQAVPE
jgi:ATP-dependent Clp protease adaptor protein ClpS